MKTQRLIVNPFKNLTGLLALAASTTLVLSSWAASPPIVLVRDSFDANTANTTDLNVDIARQTGTLAPINYTMAVGPGHYGHQLQNGNAQNQLLVADFPNSTSSLNVNFNGANSAGGLIISFDLDSIPTVYGSTPDNWGCVNLGMAQADQLANVNQGVTHFGILFRGAGTIQAFDGGPVVSPDPEPVFTTRPAGTTNHIDLVITDADGNPFDGTGNTTIEVFANGGPLPVWSYTKSGGYANNYVNVQGSFRAHFDNLTISQLGAGGGPVIANPSFEADTFTVFPGYVNGNGPITGWASPGGHGVNPGTFGGPFTDNGTIPDGTKAAFLQEDGALRQVVRGFSVGATYQIRYFENARNGGVPACEVKIAGNTIVAAHNVSPVGGANPYGEVISNPFTATSSAMELSFIKSNPQGGDTTLLIDNVSIIAPGTPPSINLQPQDQIVAFGEFAMFTVGASGSAPLSYQWYFGTDPIPNQTSPTLSVFADFPDVAGDYSVVVSNPSGTATSRVARLTVRDAVPNVFNTGVDNSKAALDDGAIDPHYRLIANPDSPSPDALVESSTAFPIVAGPWVANNAGSKWIGPRLETSGAAGGAGAAGDYVYRTVVDVTGFDPAGVVITGLWATDNEGVDILVNGQSTGQRNVTQFTGYTAFIITNCLAGPNTIDFKLNNSAVGYTGLRVDQIRALGTALPPGTPPTIVQHPVNFTATLGERVSFTSRANGSGPIDYQWYFGTDPLFDQTNATLSFVFEFPEQAGQYRLEVVSAFGVAHSSFATLIYREAPLILTQPQNQAVAVGEPASFSVTANGAEPLHYQWRKNDVDIPGANSSTYSIAAALPGDAGTYSVRVTNFAASTTSAGAILTVLEAIPGLFNTGVDDSGVSLPSGTVDPHWIITLSADVGFPGPAAFVLNDTGFPIPPWLENDSVSKWIAPQANQSGGNLEGDYTYRTTFNLAGFDPATVRVIGEWATDNTGTDILINGISTGQANTGQFVVWTPFQINTGFIAGQNTIDFKMNNAPSGVNPTGFRVRNIRALGLQLVNQAPSFTKGPDVTVAESDLPAAYPFPNWATDIRSGPPGEPAQALMFILTSDNPGLLSAAINPANGLLSITVAPNVNGVANVTVVLKDDGGTANGGVDTSAPQTFVVRVLPANQNPIARFTVSPTYDSDNSSTEVTVLSVNYSNACVTLDGSLSTDTELGPLTYAWLLDGSPIPFAAGVIVNTCLEIGEHDVTLVVSDADGGSGTTTVHVEVITAGEAVEDLILKINDADLDRKNKRPFIATLKAVTASFDRGNTTSAANQLHAFQNKVSAQVGSTDPALAEEWIQLAQAIIDAVEGQ